MSDVADALVQSSGRLCRASLGEQGVGPAELHEGHGDGPVLRPTRPGQQVLADRSSESRPDSDEPAGERVPRADWAAQVRTDVGGAP